MKVFFRLMMYFWRLPIESRSTTRAATVATRVALVPHPSAMEFRMMRRLTSPSLGALALLLAACATSPDMSEQALAPAA